MSDTEVSLTSAESRAYILKILDGYYAEEIESAESAAQIARDPWAKAHLLRQVEEYKQAMQWARSKLGC